MVSSLFLCLAFDQQSHTALQSARYPSMCPTCIFMVEKAVRSSSLKKLSARVTHQYSGDEHKHVFMAEAR